ncbi:NADH dehydrogenase (ubiquinone) [Gloeocapsa sp. PCC 7428]|uniref:NAD(P)/FAD-dependent oxidoreductase n=1 Tax=Gloeocapsa sp. PCC 7428 TaxID=1173026 RepID=UPI0002A5E0E3|nr:NAD(P)/FAD-dependent oxidoreductase [Gloeocapsa sp. PCC 7428]AFZ31772.1 NADH dehydrogenase (ubiquinone) [Gloeocapsa sp. PCC 7428]
MPRRPRVVVVGSGFGGLRATQSLARADINVLLVDRNNYHTFIPLLYQVAVAELQPEQIAYPVRSLLQRLAFANFLMAEVTHIDFANQVVITDGLTIPYDFLILSTGSESQFLGIPGADKYALPMKTLQEAVYLRNHILSCFEQAVREIDPAQRRLLLTFAIVGGGPTGVELAGALVELIQGRLVKDFPTLEMEQVQVILLQSSDRLLADLPLRLSDYTYKQLQRIGVKVYLQARVSKVTPNAVYLENGAVIFSKTIVWTAGVQASPPTPTAELFPAAKGQVAVLPTLQLPNHPQVYVVGDSAYVEQDGEPLPLVAPVALQQGTLAAQNILRQIKGKEPKPFRYVDKGRAAIIKRNAGVAQTGNFTFTGFPAWLLWLAIHLYYLPGGRNRLIVFLDWLRDYFFGDRAIRLIFPQSSRLVREDDMSNSPKDWHNQEH